MGKSKNWLFLAITAVALLYAQVVGASSARFGVAPDNSREMLSSFLAGAESELLINIYEFKEPWIADALIDRIHAGVTVRILIEAEPTEGKISVAGKTILKQLLGAMKDSGNADHRIFLLTKTKSGERRYRFNHAKYIVADRKVAYIASENFSPNPYPVAGKVGNRGWMVELHDADLVKQLLAMFASDADPSERDVVAVAPRGQLPFADDSIAGPRAIEGLNRGVARLPIRTGAVQSIQLFSSPMSLGGLQEMMQSARRTLDIEFASLPPQWAISRTRKVRSPLVQEVIQAARRGAEVRVLLNDEHVYPGNPNEIRPNQLAVRVLRGVASCYGLPIDARIIDYRAAGITYIHNKGMLADGKRVLVSSINGTRNSVENNREVAVILESPDAANYYGEAFEADWKHPNEYVDEDYCPALETDHVFGQMAPGMMWQAAFMQ